MVPYFCYKKTVAPICFPIIEIYLPTGQAADCLELLAMAAFILLG